MPRIIDSPAIIKAAENKPKIIEEFIAVCMPAFAPEMVHRDP